MEIGRRVSGSTDATLPSGTLGVYFGPEPSHQINIDESLRKFLKETCEAKPTASDQ